MRCAASRVIRAGRNAYAKERLAAEQTLGEFGLAAARDPELALAEIGCVAFANPADVCDEQGNLLPMERIPPRVQVAIAPIETLKHNVDSADGKADRMIRVRFVDKVRVLEMLAKHDGLLKESVAPAGAVEIRWMGDE